jgi:hypothetical protein
MEQQVTNPNCGCGYWHWRVNPNHRTWQIDWSKCGLGLPRESGLGVWTGLDQNRLFLRAQPRALPNTRHECPLALDVNERLSISQNEMMSIYCVVSHIYATCR